jgi:hypothetical protein
LDDGRLLLHAFCGHDTDTVLSALGLTLADLFPQRLAGAGEAGGYGPTRSRLPAADLLQVISEEVSIVAIIASDIVSNKTITEGEWLRLARATSRIGRVKDYFHGR